MNRLLRYCLSLGSCLLPLAGYAQLKSLPQEFTASTVVLTNGDTIRGSLVLHNDLDLLLVTMADGTVRTVPALAVRTFAVLGEIMRFDRLPPQYYNYMSTSTRMRRRWAQVQRARPFLVYPWDHDHDYATSTAPAFFERLNGGPVILLRRQRLVSRSMPWSDPSWVSGYTTRPVGMPAYYTDVRELLYLGTPQGSIVALRRPKRDVLAYFPAEAEQLEQFARQHNLDFNEGAHLARIVDYANSLRQMTASTQ